ncbi:MAG: hypothetical protein R2713_20520 [Ilumatobacteraceae bacterium]
MTGMIPGTTGLCTSRGEFVHHRQVVIDLEEELRSVSASRSFAARQAIGAEIG